MIEETDEINLGGLDTLRNGMFKVPFYLVVSILY